VTAAQGLWFERAFGDLYPVLYPHRDDGAAAAEVERLIDALAFTPPARILDACCGAGRHLRALRARGFDAWGADLSPHLLARARPAGEGRAVRADVRALPFRSVFDGVLNLFTSFGYFADPSQDRRALEAMVSVLAPGGVLVLDHIHRPHLAAHLVPESVDRRRDATVTQRRRIENGRVIKDVHVSFAHGGETAYTESVRLFDPDEFRALLAGAGLHRIELWGDFGGTALTPAADRMIGVGRRGDA